MEFVFLASTLVIFFLLTGFVSIPYIGGAIFTVIVYGVLYFALDWVFRKPTISLKGKNVLITGCDSGFGNRLAKRLDKQECNVYAACLTEDGKTCLDKETSNHVTPFIMDVTKNESIQQGLQFVQSKVGDDGLWGLVNNAGILGQIGSLCWVKRKDYYPCLEVNLLGLIDVTQTFIPLIKKCKGRVVNTASITGRMAYPMCGPYSVSKYGVECFTDSLRREMMLFGVSVHTIEPGFFATNVTDPKLVAQGFKKTWEDVSQELKEEYGHDYADRVVQRYAEKASKGIINKNIDEVVDAYIHAMEARFPRIRYHVGRDCKLFFIPITYLPDCLVDLLLPLVNKPIMPRSLEKSKNE